MLRSTLVVASLVLLALAPPTLASGTGAATPTVPFAFEIGRCTASIWAGLNEGGCDAAIEGTLTFTCDEDSCLITVDATSTGIRGAGTPQPVAVTVRTLLATWVEIDEDWVSPRAQRPCTATVIAETVTCSFVETYESAYHSDYWWSGKCTGIGIDVSSLSHPGHEDTAVTQLFSHRARSAEYPNSEGPAAPHYEVCLKDGALTVTQGIWYHGTST